MHYVPPVRMVATIEPRKLKLVVLLALLLGQKTPGGHA